MVKTRLLIGAVCWLIAAPAPAQVSGGASGLTKVPNVDVGPRKTPPIAPPSTSPQAGSDADAPPAKARSKSARAKGSSATVKSSGGVAPKR